MNKENPIYKDEPYKSPQVIIPESFENITNHEINEYLYENLPVGIVTSFILATILFYKLSGSIDETIFSIWYGSVLLILVLRVGLLIWFRKTKNEEELQKSQYVLFTLGSTLSASFWGILGSYLMPEGIANQAFIIIIVSGIIAGATISLGAKYITSMLYVFFSLFPIIIWEGIQVYNGIKIYVGLFIAMNLYLLYTSVTAHKSSILIIKNINLKNKNLYLLKNLTKYLNQIELFSKMGEHLEQCRSEHEVAKVCKGYILQIFPEFSGGVFLLGAHNTKLNALELWGDLSSEQKNLKFSKDECFASKTKTLYISDQINHCRHCPESSVFYVCAPLQTPLDFYGILHLKLNPDATLQKEEFILSGRALFTRIATNISFALSNIQYQKLLEAEANQDKLTELYNRRYLDNYFNKELTRFKKKSSSIAIILIDIDFFKKFNDEYGHDTGDAVLHELGLFLKHSIRGSDFACRYGGEEFMLILPDSSLEIAVKRAEKIREGVKHISILKNGKPIPTITISIGVSVFPIQGVDQASIIEAVDKALYQAKQGGRDRVCIANSNDTI